MVGMRMDADGDWTVSLEEFQATQERIFKAMDADHDGTVILEEMQDFMRGVAGRFDRLAYANTEEGGNQPMKK